DPSAKRPRVLDHLRGHDGVLAHHTTAHLEPAGAGEREQSFALIVRKTHYHAERAEPGEHVASRKRAVETEHLPPLDTRVVRKYGMKRLYEVARSLLPLGHGVPRVSSGQEDPSPHRPTAAR